MDLDARLGILIDERSDPPRLSTGEELTDHAAGGEDDRVCIVDVLRGRPIRGDVESRLAVREVERTGAVGDRIPRSRLEQTRRARMILGRTRPVDAVLRLDLFVRDD